MKRQWLGLILAAAASAAPLIRTGPDGIMNAASNIPLGAAGSGIAQGSYFVIFGSGLGPVSLAIAPSLPFDTILANTSVTINPTVGNALKAYMYYASDTQVSGILPSNTPLGDATITVTFNGTTSAAVKIRVVKSNFGIFTGNQKGSGPAAMFNVASNGVPSLNTLASAAVTGQTVSIFGTGLGPIAGPDNSAPGVVSPAGLDVRILIAGQSIVPSYAGRQPQYPGEDQINFTLPADSSVPDGCFVPFAVQVNGIVSNYATLAKSSSGAACTAPVNLSAAALQRLSSGGKITFGQFSLSRGTVQATVAGSSIAVTTDQAGGIFSAVDTNGLFGLGQTPAAVPPLNPPGTCFVQTINAVAPLTGTVPNLGPSLNAGAKVTLTGPNSKTADILFINAAYNSVLAQNVQPPGQIPSGIPGVPQAPPTVPPIFLEAGQWTVSGPGGTDVGPFTASINVPAFTCTNCATSAISRTAPLILNWTGGGGASDYVQVIGTSATPSLEDSTRNVAVVFSCAARASDQTLTVPVSILSQLPPSSGDGGLVVIDGLASSSTSFTAPLTAGGNLDFGYAGYVAVLLKNVAYN